MMESDTVQGFVPGEPEDEQRLLSRRRFLSGAATGGAMGLVVAAGTGVAGWKIAESQAQVAMNASSEEIIRLQGLLKLYEDMDKVGLDSILQAGLTALALPLGAVESGAKALRAGLESMEKALTSLQQAFPRAREAVLWLETQVEVVAGGLEKLETTVNRALDRTTGGSVVGAVRDFVNAMLDNLPFGLGEKIRSAFEELVQLVTSVDELVRGINTTILDPLRQQWFSAEEGQGVDTTFVEPLIEHILDPLQAHLEDLAALADTWQDRLLTPTQQALGERTRIREQIAQYKQQNGLS